MWTKNFQMFKLDSEKKQRNQRSNCQCLLDHRKSKRIPEKHLLLLYWLCQNLCINHNKLWKILQEIGVPDHITYLLRNLYAGQEATVKPGHGTTDGSKSGKEYIKAAYCHPAYLTYMQSTSCQMPGWNKAQAGIKIAGEISITSDMQMTPPLWQKWRRTK